MADEKGVLLGDCLTLWRIGGGCLQEVIGMIFMISVNQFSFLNFGADYPKLKYQFSFLEQINIVPLW